MLWHLSTAFGSATAAMTFFEFFSRLLLLSSLFPLQKKSATSRRQKPETGATFSSWRESCAARGSLLRLGSANPGRGSSRETSKARCPAFSFTCSIHFVFSLSTQRLTDCSRAELRNFKPEQHSRGIWRAEVNRTQQFYDSPEKATERLTAGEKLQLADHSFDAEAQLKILGWGQINTQGAGSPFLDCTCSK